MGTSSNFGNMFSAAGASLFLDFLPMLPTQILLNNLLYDVSEITIPTDNVDQELLAPAGAVGHRLHPPLHGVISSGPISSIYDFLTFAVMLIVFDAGPPLFRSAGSSSLVTQTARHLHHPHAAGALFRSRPSLPLFVARR